MQATGKKNIHHVAIILLKAPFGRRHSPGDVERLGDERRKAFHQHSRNESDEHEVDVCVKGANPRTKCFVVEPGRFFKIVEKIPQGLRRSAQNLIPLLYAGPDEPVQVIGRQRSEFFHHRVELGVAYDGVSDIVVGRFLVVETGLCVTIDVC